MHILQLQMQSPLPTQLNSVALSDDNDYQPKPLLDLQKSSKVWTQKAVLKHVQVYNQKFHHLHTDIGVIKNSNADNLSFEITSDDTFVDYYLEWLTKKEPVFSQTRSCQSGINVQSITEFCEVAPAGRSLIPTIQE